MRLADDFSLTKGETELIICIKTTDNKGDALIDLLTIEINYSNSELADFTIENPLLDPTTAEAGDDLNISWEIANRGLTVSENSSVQIFFSSDNTVDNNDEILVNNDFDPIEIDDFIGFNETITLSDNIADGSYFIIILIDGENTVTETNESNNILSLPIKIETINQPEIVIMNVITPNGDGENDELYIENIEFYPENEVIFIDSKGNEIFRKSGYTNEWFPNHIAQKLTIDTYLCIVKLTPDAEEPIYKMVTLLIE